MAVITVPVPCTNPAGPYSISHGPPGFGLVQDTVAEVDSGTADKPVGVRHCESTFMSSTNHLSPLSFSITNAIKTF